MGACMNGTIFQFAVGDLDLVCLASGCISLYTCVDDSVNMWDYCQASMIRLYLTYNPTIVVEEFVI